MAASARLDRLARARESTPVQGERQPADEAGEWPGSESVRFGHGLAVALLSGLVFWLLLAGGIWRWLAGQP